MQMNSRLMALPVRRAREFMLGLKFIQQIYEVPTVHAQSRWLLRARDESAGELAPRHDFYSMALREINLRVIIEFAEANTRLNPRTLKLKTKLCRGAKQTRDSDLVRGRV